MGNTDTVGALLTFNPTPAFDPDNLMTQAGFVAPTAGQYNFAFNLEWTRPFGALTDGFQLGIVPYSNTNNQELINFTLWSQQLAAGSNASGEAEWVFSVKLGCPRGKCPSVCFGHPLQQTRHKALMQKIADCVSCLTKGQAMGCGATKHGRRIGW